MNINKRTSSDTDIDTVLKTSLINPFDYLPTSPKILSIDNKTYGTRGNFSCIVGKPKSRKTFLLALLEANLIADSLSKGRIESYIQDTDIIHFDLEQSIYHARKFNKRVISLSGEKALKKLKVYTLREHGIKTRRLAIERAIKKSNNLSLVVIDGIADLVNSYNDEEQAHEIVKHLMNWSKTSNIHIIVVIHTTKTSSDPKGHLGSIIMQKAETVLTVSTEKNKNLTNVSTLCSRNEDEIQFSFKINDKELPELIY